MPQWLPAAERFREVDQRREEETDRDRLRRLAAIRSRARTTQQPIVVLLDPPKIGHRPRIEVSPAQRRRVAGEISRGASQAEAAKVLGWSVATLHRRMREDPELRAAVDEATDARRQLSLPGLRHAVAYVTKRRLASGRVRYYAACTCSWKPLSNRTPALARKAIADHAQREVARSALSTQEFRP